MSERHTPIVLFRAVFFYIDIDAYQAYFQWSTVNQGGESMDIHPAITSFFSFLTSTLLSRDMTLHQRIRKEFGQDLSEGQVELIECAANAYCAEIQQANQNAVRLGRRYGPSTYIENVLYLPDFKCLLFSQYPEFDPDIAQAI